MHALSAEKFGTSVYLENVLSILSNKRFANNVYYVYVPENNVGKFSNMPKHIKILTSKFASQSTIHRLLWDEIVFRRIASKSNVDVIWCTADFSILFSPCPQIVNLRNAVYFDKIYMETAGLKLRLITWLRRQMSFLSILAADIVLTPSQAMQDIIRRFHKFERVSFQVVHHGFNPEYFLQEAEKEPFWLREKLAKITTEQRNIFYPSFFRRYKNFETLMRAIPLIKKMTQYGVKFVLNVDRNQLARDDATETLRLINELNLWNDLILLGAVPYRYMHCVYELTDLVIYPSYTESFGHPMVEAMYCGKPIVASKIPITQEICQNAAVYFDTFDEFNLAEKVCEVLDNQALQQKLIQYGLKRLRDFSWDKHVNAIVELLEKLASK